MNEKTINEAMHDANAELDLWGYKKMKSRNKYKKGNLKLAPITE